MDIQVVMHTLSLSPPDDQWYTDTRATSHMKANGGNNIIVGSGQNIPVIGCGHA